MKKLNLLAVAAVAIWCTGCAIKPNSIAAQSVSSATNVSAPAPTPVMKVATWNAEHFAFPIDAGCKPRTDAEITAMQDYAKSLDAKIIALQEVASEQALRLIFPEDKWQLVLSERPDSPTYECRESGFTSTQQKVAFAIDKSVELLKVTNNDDLGLDIPGLRYGLVVTVETPIGVTDVLNVHMKSGCFVDDFSQSDKEACLVLAKQIPLLEQWVAKREEGGKPYIILGDFNHRLSAPYNRLTRILNRHSSLNITTKHLIGCHPRYPALIDHIIVGGTNSDFISRSAQTHHYDDMNEKAMLSDHCAVSVSLQDAGQLLTPAEK
ncbi:MAG: endonuclease/exonuclease/phosphatase family protein [Aestuariibacter sp.]